MSMHTTMIARLANEIVNVLERTKQVEDHHVPTLLEDVRARLDWMGMDLENVVLAGIYRIGRVSAKMASWAEREYQPQVFLTTANWREKIGETLESHCDLAWRYRTFLKVLLTQDAITLNDLIYANSILLLDARDHEEKYKAVTREEADKAASDDRNHSPPTQLTLV